MSEHIRILLVDDHEIVRAGMRQILSNVPSMEVVGEASTGKEALELLNKLKPDVVLMDYKMPEMNGLDAAKALHLKKDKVKILMVSAIHPDQFFLTQLFQNGVAGFLDKNSSAEEMIKAINCVYEDKRYISPQLLSNIDFKNLETQSNFPFDELSERELQVTILTIDGLTIGEISDKLEIKTKSVQSYLTRIMEKLKVDNKIKLILLADRLGLTKNF